MYKVTKNVTLVCTCVSCAFLTAVSESAEFTKPAITGTPSTIRRYFSWTANCNSQHLSVRVTRHPAHGYIEINDSSIILSDIDVRGGYVGKCVGVRLNDKVVTYTSNPDFVGQDRFSVYVRSDNFELSDDYNVEVEHDYDHSAVLATRSDKVLIPMIDDGGTFKVPATINGRLQLNFIVDSGVSDVSVPADVVMTLIRTGTITDADFMGEQTYRLADGSRLPSQQFVIHSLKVGQVTLENVIGSVAPVAGSLLLGQSFLRHFKSWSIDNERRLLSLQ